MYKLSLLLALLLTQNSYAIEEKVFKLQGTDSVTSILEKLGASKNTSLPAEIKSKDAVITVEQTNPKMITIDFTPSHSFTISDADLFEKIETNENADRINHSLIIADPKTGRIFHLNNELKVSKLELLSPWTSKVKPLTLKIILNGMSSQKIEKKK